MRARMKKNACSIFCSSSRNDLPSRSIPLPHDYDINKRALILQRLTKRIVAHKSIAYDPHTGKTLGVRIPPNIANRLRTQKQSHNIKSYRHTVMIAMKLGLEQLELTNGSPNPIKPIHILPPAHPITLEPIKIPKSDPPPTFDHPIYEHDPEDTDGTTEPIAFDTQSPAFEDMEPEEIDAVTMPTNVADLFK